MKIVSLSALLLLSSHSHAQSWHSDLQPHEKYYPEHEEHLRREWEIRQRMQIDKPVGMRKLSGDAGEKFFLDYWMFEQASSDAESEIRLEDARNQFAYSSEQSPSTNDSSIELLPPVSLHSDRENSIFSRYFRRDLFERSFQCPIGTTNCSSIGQPNSCCQNGEVCVSVANSPVGPVGCCPSGETCNGPVATCNTAQGYTSCPNSPNGGCCIPGYACKDVGCQLSHCLCAYCHWLTDTRHLDRHDNDYHKPAGLDCYIRYDTSHKHTTFLGKDEYHSCDGRGPGHSRLNSDCNHNSRAQSINKRYTHNSLADSHCSAISKRQHKLNICSTEPSELHFGLSILSRKPWWWLLSNRSSMRISHMSASQHSDQYSVCCGTCSTYVHIVSTNLAELFIYCDKLSN